MCVCVCVCVCISLIELVRRCGAATSPTLQFSVKSKQIVAGDRLILSSFTR